MAPMVRSRSSRRVRHSGGSREVLRKQTWSMVCVCLSPLITYGTCTMMVASCVEKLTNAAAWSPSDYRIMCLSGAQVGAYSTLQFP